MLLNIAVSQNRNMWVGLVIGFALMVVFGGPRLRYRVLAAAGVLAAGAVLLLSAGLEVDDQSRFAPIIERGTTLFDPAAVGQEKSLTHRGEETGLAWESARENLLFGIGPGTNFGVTFGERRPDGTTRTTTQNFVHNQYLYLLMIGGIPLLAAFLCYLGSVLRRAADRLDDTVLPLAVGLVMIMVSAVVMIYYSSFEMVATIATLTGALVAWTREPEPAWPA
jgi:O-antigen ligase